MNIDIETFKFKIKSAASNTARLFPGYAEAADLEGELWVWALENKQTVLKYSEDGEDGQRKLAFVLRQKAMAYAQTLKAAKLGYSPDDLAGYSVKALKVLLEDAFDYENWESSSTDYSPTIKAKRIEATGDRITSLIDVKAAVEKLDERNYNIIVGRYKYNYTNQEIADMMEIGLTSVGTTINRAVAALSKLLSIPEPDAPTGRRTVQSNAASRAALQNNYEG